MRTISLMAVLSALLPLAAISPLAVGGQLLADDPPSLTPEQQSALAAIDVRLKGVEALAAQIPDPAYQAEVLRQIADLHKNRRSVQENFDQAACEALMLSVISRYQIVALWLKTPAVPAPQHNSLSPDEAAAGWRLLFDGQSLAGWRGYRSPTAPGSWQIESGSLLSRRQAGVSSGDLITTEQFADFELLVDWKMTAGNNSGIIYRATEEHEQVWQSGPEYQVLDNTAHLDGHNPLASAGACYAVFAPAKNLALPVGQWNTSRIVAHGKHIEHWLNGEKVVEYDIDSDVWKAHVKTSKFFPTAYGQGNWGRSPNGHIGLQDYGGAIEFRNLKIRPRRSP